MTQEEAIAKGATKWWETATPEEIVELQLFEEFLCVPFPIYHGAIEKVLGRPVWTHEFGSQGRLKEEYARKKAQQCPA